MKHIAILGSSLISVIEAITQSRLGHKVTIIDKNDDIGGAWKLENSLGYKNIEVGCHILIPTGKSEFDNKSYSELESFTGIKLVKLDSKPINISVNPLNDSDPEDIEYYYPKNGLPEVLKNLRNAISENSIEYLNSHKVTDIHLKSKDEVEIKTNKANLKFNKVTFPTYFGLEKLKCENEEISIPFSRRTSTHLTMKVSGNENKFTYCQLDDSTDVIDRVSRVSKYVPELDLKKYDVLCARVSHTFKDKNTFDLSSAELAFKCLVNNNLLSPEAELIGFDFHQYTTHYRTEEMIEKLSSVNHPTFFHLDSRALINSLGLSMDRWEKTLVKS